MINSNQFHQEIESDEADIGLHHILGAFIFSSIMAFVFVYVIPEIAVLLYR